MRRCLLVLMLLPAVSACTVQTASFYAPIRIEVAGQAPRLVVIRNLNPPHDCRVVPEDSIYPAIYGVVFGSASEAAAERWARQNCRR